MLKGFFAVLALLALGILCFLCLRKNAPEIEAGLASTAGTALSQEQISWANVSMDGRELTLEGVAPNWESRDRATQIVKAVHGVRTVENRMTVAMPTLVEPEPTVISGTYFTRVTSNQDGVRVSGLAPDKNSRDLLIRLAKAQSGAAQVENKLKVVSGAPDGWTTVMQATLSKLGQFDNVTAALQGNELMVMGRVPSIAVRDQVQNAIRTALPNNYRATYDIAVPPPVVAAAPAVPVEVKTPPPRPYATIITSTKQGVSLVGLAPDASSRDRLVTLAKNAFGASRVTDQLVVMPGAHEGWTTALATAIGKLDQFDEGTVKLVDTDLSVMGRVAEASTRDRVQRDIGASLPSGYRASYEIATPPPKVEVPPPRPYATVITSSKQGVSLVGLAPDASSRDRLVTLAKNAFGASRVTDQLVVMPGAQKGWTTALATALGKLDQFDEGTVKLVDTDLSVMGRVAEASTRDRVQRDIGAALPSGYRATYDISTPPVKISREDEFSKAIECPQRFLKLLSTQSVLFETSQPIISSHSLGLLNGLASVAAGCSKTRIEIAGHTDSRGAQASNLALSQARATAVKDYLISKGVSGNRLSAVGYGETRLIADDSTITGRAKNRRVELNVLFSK